MPRIILSLGLILIIAGFFGYAQFTPPSGGGSGNATSVNGASVPTSKTCVGTNSSGQFIDATSNCAAPTFSVPYIVSGGNSYGPLFAETVPPASPTGINAGTSTLNVLSGGALHVLYQNAAGTDTARGYGASVPGSTYTLLVHCRQGIYGACGLMLTDGTKCEDFFFADGHGTVSLELDLLTYTACSNSGVNIVQSWQFAQGMQEMWLKLVEDGTHRTFYVSTCNDFTSAQIYRQESTGTFLTPTVVGFGSDTGGSSIPGAYDVLILSFSLVSGVH